MSYRAIVLGGTGAVGSSLVRDLLGSPACAGVVALVRRPVDLFANSPGHEKLRVEVVPLDQLEAATAPLARGCTVAFCTMGMGQPRKSTFEEFRRIDVEYPGAFARGAKAAGIRHISLLSSVGADVRSATRYLRVKGDAEEAIAAPGFQRTSLFRPSLLVTKDIRYGLQDRLTQALFPLFTPLLPSRFHQITVEQLGRAMRLNAERPGEGVEVLHYTDFMARQA